MGTKWVSMRDMVAFHVPILIDSAPKIVHIHHLGRKTYGMLEGFPIDLREEILTDCKIPLQEFSIPSYSFRREASQPSYLV